MTKILLVEFLQVWLTFLEAEMASWPAALSPHTINFAGSEVK